MVLRNHVLLWLKTVHVVYSPKTKESAGTRLSYRSSPGHPPSYNPTPFLDDDHGTHLVARWSKVQCHFATSSITLGGRFVSSYNDVIIVVYGCARSVAGPRRNPWLYSQHRKPKNEDRLQRKLP